MNFQDIESGSSQPLNSSFPDTPQSREEAAFINLPLAPSSRSTRTCKVSSSVVDQLGTPRDSSSLRKRHDLMEATHAVTKRGSDDLKKLSALQVTLPSKKAQMQKTAHDSQLSFVASQRAQQVSMEKQRTVVKSVKLAVEEDQETLSQHAEAAPEQLQAQVMQSQLSPHELAYQESHQEREAEIREIETGIHELSEIFRGLGTLVHGQGGMLAADTSGAAEELSTASEYQRKAGRRAACLGLILIVTVAVVLLAVCHPFPCKPAPD
ncbi:t-SNARE [Lactarius vividus]|nr:t-SNARE [Lactarius vividus]